MTNFALQWDRQDDGTYGLSRAAENIFPRGKYRIDIKRVEGGSWQLGHKRYYLSDAQGFIEESIRSGHAKALGYRVVPLESNLSEKDRMRLAALRDREDEMSHIPDGCGCCGMQPDDRARGKKYASREG